MARESRVVVRARDDFEANEIWHAFRDVRDRFDLDREGEEIYCFVDAPADPESVRRNVMDTLGELGLSGLLELPEIEYWDEEQFSYVSPAEAERLPELTDVQWLVTVEPASIFDWRPTREELARRNRPVVAESQRALSVPAESEQDALELVAALERVPGIGRATAKKLGWFRRWWLRERLFGNYGGAPSGP